MSTFHFKHMISTTNFGDAETNQHSTSVYTCIGWLSIVLFITGIIDRILLTNASMPLLSLQVVCSYLFLVFCPKPRWVLIIGPIIVLQLLSHWIVGAITWSILLQVGLATLTTLVSAFITQRVLCTTPIFTVRFIHLLISCATVYVIIYEFLIAVITLRIEALNPLQWQYLSSPVIAQITGFVIVSNIMLMFYMRMNNDTYTMPKLTDNALILLVFTSLGTLCTLYFGSNLIQYLSVFLVIPGLWFCYRYRWWGLSSFVFIINTVALAYVLSVTSNALLNSSTPLFPLNPVHNSNELLLQLGFSFAEMSWFLLGLNLIIIYINAMIFELDKTQTSIEVSQAAMLKRNDELADINLHIQKLNQHLLHAQESQRRRLSIELKNEMEQNIHELQQSINLLELQASFAGNQSNPFTKIKSFTHYIFMSVFELINWLKPEILERLGLIGTLKSPYFNDKLALNKIEFEFSTHGELINIPESIELVLFRITQEAVNNTIKYSKASKFTVQLSLLSNRIEYIICDNGVGFDISTIEQGLGLTGMKNRVRALDGTYLIDSTDGTRIALNLPI